MTEKLYVEAISRGNPALGIESYNSLTLMRLPPKLAQEKASLLTRIQSEFESLIREFPKPTDESKYKQ